MPMVLNIAFDHLRRDLITDSADKVAILPKLSTPELLAQLGKFLAQSTRRNALQEPDDFGNRVPGRKIQEQMDMVFRHLHFLNLTLEIRGDLAEQFGGAVPNIFAHNPSAVFGCPYEMVCGIVNGMTGTLDRHPAMLAHLCLPTAGRTFPPRPQGGAPKFVF
jgi:hypothetical protein